MGSPDLNRRQFLLSGLAAAAAGTLGGECHLSPTPFEGIYTDRFTYRQGEPIHVASSLRSAQTVLLELRALHSSAGGVLSFHTAEPPNFGNAWNAGVLGARFLYRTSIDSGSLEPGVYELRIPSTHLAPENLINDYNNFPSKNTVARFVVTAPTPGSHARILWVHDSLTGSCYGSFGGQSIYGGQPGVKAHRVSTARPGLDRSTYFVFPLRFLLEHGFAFEFADLIALSTLTNAELAEYDLVICLGPFEYMPNEAMVRLRDFVAAGGNLFVAANEFAIFRVRLDAVQRTLTTYKYEFETLDPLFGTGSPNIAGVGMNSPDGVLDAELIGQHLWAAHRVTNGSYVDLPLYPSPDTDWILADTGLGSGDVLPGAFKNFATGQRLDLGSGAPVILDPATSRTFPGTEIWAALPSPDGKAWWLANGQPVNDWPPISDGYATASYQQRPSGGRVLTLPTATPVNDNLGDPLYDQLLVNIVSGLS